MPLDPELFAEQWIGRVLAAGPTDTLTPADRDAIGSAIRACYRGARLRRPVTVVWCPTPDAAQRWSVSADQRLQEVLAAAPRLRRRLRLRARTDRPLTAIAAAVLCSWTAYVMAFALYCLACLGIFSIVLGLVLVALAEWSARWPAPGVTPSAGRTWLLAGIRTTGALLAVGPPVARAARGEAILATGPLLSGDWMLIIAAAVGVLVGPAGAIMGWRQGRVKDAARRVHLVGHCDHQLRSAVPGQGDRSPAQGLALRTTLAERLSTADPLANWLPRPLPLLRMAELAYRMPVRSVAGRLLAVVTDGPFAALPHRRPGRILQAHELAGRVSWTAFGRFVVAVEPPITVHADASGPHCPDGPAVVWSDGTPWYALHGVRVPRSPVNADWTIEEIHDVADSETRRAMIEAIGWPQYIRDAGLELLDTAPDPGNPPHRLALYELPVEQYAGARLLVMTNASPDRSGALRHYAELVPDEFDDPVEAAAWQYGLPAEVYREMERRT